MKQLTVLTAYVIIGLSLIAGAGYLMLIAKLTQLGYL